MSEKTPFDYRALGSDVITKGERDWIIHYCSVAPPSAWRNALCTLLRSHDRLEELNEKTPCPPTSADVT